MSKTIEQKTVFRIEEGKITRANIIEDGKAVEIVTAFYDSFEEIFPVVDIENVSLRDKFLQYEPKSGNGKRIKASIIKAKKIQMKNFRKAVMDPSFVDDGETIIFSARRKPAVGKSPLWWDENALKFMPEKNSRLIYDLEKDVFLGVLIKDLVEEGYDVEEAWDAVCINSTQLGHFRNSKNAKQILEMTGSRKIGKWCDLGNTCKIVKKTEEDFVLFGGSYDNYSHDYPLADEGGICYPNNDYYNSVGELVLDV